MFGLRTLGPIFGSAVSGWVALSDRHMLMDDPDLWLLVFFGLACGLISWVCIARDSYDKEQAQHRLQQTLDDLVSQLAPLPTGQLRNWNQATNTAIKIEVQRLAAVMQEFGRRIKQERISHNTYRMATDEQQRLAAFLDFSERSAAQSAAQVADFNEQFRPGALALRDEMRRRLGILPSRHAMQQSVALDYGMLAGPDPVIEAAIEIQRLAQQLPD